MSERVHRIHTLPDDAPWAGGLPPVGSEEHPRTIRMLDRVLAIQRPAVLAHLRSIRLRHPHAAPDEIVRILERRYLTAVTTGGAAVGATAVVPGVGTGVTLALSGVETVGFLEATTLFAQSVAEVHGIAVDDPDRARALVLTLMLGKEGVDLVAQLAAQAAGRGPGRAGYWGELVTKTLPRAAVGPVVDRLKTAFIHQFAARGGASWIGKALPFGVGAVVGGAGNHILGRRVLVGSRRAFGPPPPQLPHELEPRPDAKRVEHAAISGVQRAGGAVAGATGSAVRGVGAAARRVGSTTRRALGRRQTRRRTPRTGRRGRNRHGGSLVTAEIPGAPHTALAALTTWMPQQRWFAGKGRTPVLEHVASWQLGTNDGAAVELHLVADVADARRVLYQVPIVSRPADGDARVGEIGHLDGQVLIDGAADPAFHEVLYDWVTRGSSVTDADGTLTGSTTSAPGIAATASASILAGEQSNTSLIYRPEDGSTPVICKLFRQVGIGVNPDIELQSALAASGARFVPPVIGTVEGEWLENGTPVSGSLAFAQEFFPAVEDAWRVALRAASEGTAFAEPAAALGRAVAQMLDTLAAVFPTRPATDADRAVVAAGWRDRWDAAIVEVPTLEASRVGVEAAYAEALAAPWPDLQRVHGDLHLGQVLEVAGRGWVLLDFEGEPLRPIAERRELDVPVRDVAGMLRSFAYAADALRDQVDVQSRRAWAAEARAGFLRGYAESAASGLDPALLRALEIDKSVYQTVYDARNRPEWTPIPLAAIAELIGA